jgi:hypothetical protein
VDEQRKEEEREQTRSVNNWTAKLAVEAMSMMLYIPIDGAVIALVFNRREESLEWWLGQQL